jgi:hypothetical protein
MKPRRRAHRLRDEEPRARLRRFADRRRAFRLPRSLTARRARRPYAVAIPVWSVHVETHLHVRGKEPPWEALDAVVEAVEADERTVNASAAGDPDDASLFVSLTADDPDDARELAKAIVRRALERLALETHASALQVYDDEGNLVG